MNDEKLERANRISAILKGLRTFVDKGNNKIIRENEMAFDALCAAARKSPEIRGKLIMLVGQCYAELKKEFDSM